MKRFWAALLALCLLTACKSGSQEPEQPIQHELPQSAVEAEEPAVSSEASVSLDSSIAALEEEVAEEPEADPVPPPIQPAPVQPVEEPEAAEAGILESNLAVEPQTSVMDCEKVEQELLRLVNAQRQSKGLEQLGLEDRVQWAARIRSEEVLDSLMHTRPNGRPYNTAFDEVGLSYAGRLHGENISTFQITAGSYTEEELAQEIFNKLCSSSGHSSNMFSDNFIQIGIGVFAQQNEDTIRIGVTQLFLGM